MTIAIDGTPVHGVGNASTATTTGLTTSNAGDIIIIAVTAYKASGNPTFNTPTASSGVTGITLIGSELDGAASVSVWYGKAASTLSGVTFTGSTSTTSVGVTVHASAWSGVNQTTPLDTNGALPAKATGTTTAVSVTFSTTNANDAIFLFVADDSGSAGTKGNIAGSTSTLLDSTPTANANDTGSGEYLITSSAQSSKTALFTCNSAVFNWAGIVFALQQVSSTSINVTDSGHGSDSVSIPTIKYLLTDSGHGVDIAYATRNLPYTITETGQPVYQGVGRTFSSGVLSAAQFVITNTQSTGTGTNWVQHININPSIYPYAQSLLENINWQDGNGNIITSWNENGTSNGLSSADYWLLLPQGINANSSVVVYLCFYSTTYQTIDGTITGVSPIVGLNMFGLYSYYDNGTSVFPFYDDFAGTSLASGWTPFSSPNNPTSYTINNGITINSSGSQWVGWYNTNYTVPQPGIIEGLFATTSATGDVGIGIVNSFIFENRQDNENFRIEFAVPSPSNNDGSGGTAAQNTAYVVTGWNYVNPTMDINYVRTVNGSGSGQTSGNPSIEVYGTSSGTGTGVFTWIRSRPYPPNGVTPSVSAFSIINVNYPNTYLVINSAMNGSLDGSAIVGANDYHSITDNGLHISSPWDITVNLQDYGHGSDSITLITSQTVTTTDSGHGTESVSITVKVTVVDNGNGTHGILVIVPISITDSGHGSDIVIVKVTTSLIDSGHGSDSISITSKLTLSDNGHGTDTIAITLTPHITDSGHGLDSVSWYGLVSLIDSGHESDSVIIGVSFKLIDSGHGSDTAVAIGQVKLTDSGHGTDSITVKVEITLSDSGHGTDVITVGVDISITDSGHGSDSEKNWDSVSDSCHGSDSITIKVYVTLADSGTGLDVVTVIFNKSVADSGHGTDFISASGVFVMQLDSGHCIDVIRPITATIPLTDNRHSFDNVFITSDIDNIDSGSGYDTTSISAILSLTDSGTETTLVTIPTENKSLFDTGIETNVLSIYSKFSLLDVGHGNMGVSIRASLNVSDTGLGIDSVASITSKLPSITDSGHGTESVSVHLGFSLLDFGHGTEVKDVIKESFRLSDSGHETDTISILTERLLIDSGRGIDSILNIRASFDLTDSGHGVDSLQLFAQLDKPISDSGHGTDRAFQGTEIKVFDSGKGVVSLETVQIVETYRSRVIYIPNRNIVLRVNRGANF